MKSFKYFYIISISLFIWQFTNYAQTKYNSFIVTDTLTINFDNHYPISKVNIIPNTEQIYLKGKLLSQNAYKFNYSKGYFTLSDSLPYSIFDTLIVNFKSLKLSLQKEYKHRSLVVKYDEKFGDTVRVLTSTGSGLTPEAIFGPGYAKKRNLSFVVLQLEPQKIFHLTAVCVFSYPEEFLKILKSLLPYR